MALKLNCIWKLVYSPHTSSLDLRWKVEITGASWSQPQAFSQCFCYCAGPARESGIPETPKRAVRLMPICQDLRHFLLSFLTHPMALCGISARWTQETWNLLKRYIRKARSASDVFRSPQTPSRCWKHPNPQDMMSRKGSRKGLASLTAAPLPLPPLPLLLTRKSFLLSPPTCGNFRQVAYHLICTVAYSKFRYQTSWLCSCNGKGRL